MSLTVAKRRALAAKSACTRAAVEVEALLSALLLGLAVEASGKVMQMAAAAEEEGAAKVADWEAGWDSAVASVEASTRGSRWSRQRARSM